MANEKIFIDVSTNKSFREDHSEIANLNAPENIYKVSRDFDIQYLNSQHLDVNGDYDDEFTGWVGHTITARAAVDNNHRHISSAQLNSALSNGVPVSTITIKNIGTYFSTRRPAGTLELSETESVNYNLLTDNGDGTYTLRTADADFVTANFTPPADYAESLTIVTVELALITDIEVDVTNKDAGLLTITNNAYNSIFQAEAEYYGEEIDGCWQEITIIEDAVSIRKDKFTCRCLGAIDDDGGVAPPPEGNYYNKTESDSRYVRQALSTAYSAVSSVTAAMKMFVREGSSSKYATIQQLADAIEGLVTGTEQDCADDSTTNIVLFDKTLYRRCEVVFTLDYGANIIDYVYKVGYDGTATPVDDGGETVIWKGSEITGVTISFDISGDNVRLVITTSSVGGVVNCVYKVKDILILST